MEHRFFDDPIRLVLDALPALVADHVLLVREVRLVDHVEQVPHAVRFEPQPELELVGGQGFEVVGAIEVGGAVDRAAARPFDRAEMHVAGRMFRALEHHVLEEVGKAGPPRWWVDPTAPSGPRLHASTVVATTNAAAARAGNARFCVMRNPYLFHSH